MAKSYTYTTQTYLDSVSSAVGQGLKQVLWDNRAKQEVKNRMAKAVHLNYGRAAPQIE